MATEQKRSKYLNVTGFIPLCKGLGIGGVFILQDLNDQCSANFQYQNYYIWDKENEINNIFFNQGKDTATITYCNNTRETLPIDSMKYKLHPIDLMEPKNNRKLRLVSEGDKTIISDAPSSGSTYIYRDDNITICTSLHLFHPAFYADINNIDLMRLKFSLFHTSGDTVALFKSGVIDMFYAYFMGQFYELSNVGGLSIHQGSRPSIKDKTGAWITPDEIAFNPVKTQRLKLSNYLVLSARKIIMIRASAEFFFINDHEEIFLSAACGMQFRHMSINDAENNTPITKLHLSLFSKSHLTIDVDTSGLPLGAVVCPISHLNEVVDGMWSFMFNNRMKFVQDVIEIESVNGVIFVNITAPDVEKCKCYFDGVNFISSSDLTTIIRPSYIFEEVEYFKQFIVPIHKKIVFLDQVSREYEINLNGENFIFSNEPMIEARNLIISVDNDKALLFSDNEIKISYRKNKQCGLLTKGAER